MRLLRRVAYRFRSAVTGRFISRRAAAANPDTTVRERRPRKVPPR